MPCSVKVGHWQTLAGMLHLLPTPTVGTGSLGKEQHGVPKLSPLAGSGQTERTNRQACVSSTDSHHCLLVSGPRTPGVTRVWLKIFLVWMESQTVREAALTVPVAHKLASQIQVLALSPGNWRLLAASFQSWGLISLGAQVRGSLLTLRALGPEALGLLLGVTALSCGYWAPAL